MKATLMWNGNGNKKGGNYAIKFIDNPALTGEWESIDSMTQQKAVEFDLPKGWSVDGVYYDRVDGEPFEYALVTPGGELVNDGDCVIEANGDLTVIALECTAHIKIKGA